MAFRPTPEIVRATWALIRVTPPARTWGLPPAEQLGVRITRHRDRYADYGCEKGRHVIRISERSIGSFPTLWKTLWHEAVHCRQRLKGTETRAAHNAEFWRLARRVAAVHGFDPNDF